MTGPNIFFILLLSITFNVYAQDGKLSGKVTDAKSNEVLPLAIVNVMQKGVLKNATTTNANGFYNISNLQPGEYEINVTYPAYNHAVTKKIVVTSLKTTFVNLSLKPSKNENEKASQSKVKKDPSAPDVKTIGK